MQQDDRIVVDLGTRRDVFETIKAHLLAQKAKSVSDQGGCMYRSPDGLKCAIGCLIPDDAYTSAMEGSIGDLMKFIEFRIDGRSIERSFNDRDFFMLQMLQTVHDMFDVKSWHMELNSVERMYF
jgi:hypothetical protein